MENSYLTLNETRQYKQGARRMKKVNNKEYEEVVYENALELIEKYGIKGWNMDDLARNSGLAKKTLYAIIGSKENLISRLFLSGMLDNKAAIEKIISSNKTNKEKLEILFNDIPKRFSGFTRRFAKDVSIEYPLLKKELKQKDEVSHEIFKNFMDDCQKDGIIREDIDIDAYIILTHVFFDALIMGDHSDSDFERISKVFMDITMNGLVKR